MKKQLQQLRRFFVRTKNYNATAARAAVPASYEDDDDGGNRLSGAFIVVLLLHVVAIVGVFAFARIKDNRKALTPAEPPTQAATARVTAPPPKPAPASPAIAAATPAPAQVHETLKTPTPGSRSVHIVQSGETITKIAFAFNVPVNDLISANKLKNQDDIHIGQPLTIPEKGPAARTPAVVDAKRTTAVPTPNKTQTPATDKKTPGSYIVKKGDTAAKIAREHGCTYEDLVKLNNIKDPKKIQPGQVMKLPIKNG